MIKLTKLAPIMFLLLALGSLSACSSNKSKLAPEPSAKVNPTPTTTTPTQTSCGNEPSYTLEGKTYQVLPSTTGYREEGLASWYGAEFQGSSTAGCEVFDMKAFSAAHRTLPLPSFVRVTRLDNNKSVIVRVNDRGPFDKEGLIQLSFAAANALGMTGSSQVANVRVEALDTKQPSTSASNTTVDKRTVVKPSPAQKKAISEAKATGKSFYIVVKNYQDQMDALDMFVRLTSVGLSKTEMASARQDGRPVHQVRIGPLYTQDQIDNVKDALESNGLATFKVVPVEE
ncbi:septal ring lytic transglycosylase RlpA family protein [Thiolinea disciformis]|uniref:septal ring lytic transglycosylase RlpA family protein n=1 Tax=Thiolinea disciformis TaxID=125614 RepID=UPI000376AC33|nr:septal ring lytic transglycosylase RlpA family protein [Thiolinea disciformis]